MVPFVPSRTTKRGVPMPISWREVRAHLLWLSLAALAGSCGVIDEDETRARAASGSLSESSVTSQQLLGRIVVNHDEWTLSNAGFNRSANAAAFARNVAQWFTGGQPGDFLAYSVLC